jgi:hypothetical protein
MKIPNIEQAVVAYDRIVGYLLNPEHPEGGDKCEYFIRFGFSVAQWEVLAMALIDHAARNEVMKTEATKYGTRYVVEGPVTTPDKRNPELRSVWFIRNDETFPRLVTAYRLRD